MEVEVAVGRERLDKRIVRFGSVSEFQILRGF
jgi:hypothetical protein